MHIVYIVGPTDPGDQLRYALRSLSANLDHAFDVTIVGIIPSWINTLRLRTRPNVQDGAKQANIRKSIRSACSLYPDEWVLVWDDVFICRPIDAIPRLHRGPMSALVAEHAAERPLTSYLRDLQATGKALEAEGIAEPIAYDCIHVPQTIHSPTMLRALDLAEQHSVNGVLTIHGNLRPGPPGELSGNAKAVHGWSRRTFVSINHRRWRAEPVGAWLRDLFPDPSPWEK